MKRLFLIVFLFMQIVFIEQGICKPTKSSPVFKQVNVASVSASSHESPDKTRNKVFTADMAFDNNVSTRWTSNFQDSEWIQADLGKVKTIGKIVLHWEAAYGETYQLQVSKDKRNWYVVENAIKQNGSRDEFTFGPVAARYVRMFGIARGTDWGYSLYEFKIYTCSNKAPVSLSNYKKPEEITYSTSELSPKAYYSYMANNRPEGYYPKWLNKKMGYWTVVGSPDSPYEALLCEDGMIDFYENGFALIPYLYIDNKLITAEDAISVTQNLEEGYLPIPTVEWDCANITFTQKFFPISEGGNSSVYCRYTLKNRSNKEVSGKLFLTIRPFQVTPLWMFGGFIQIESIEEVRKVIKINNKDGLVTLQRPQDFGALAYEDGDIMELIKNGGIPTKKKVESASKYCTAVLSFDFKINPNEQKEYMFVVPLDENINEFNTSINKRSFVAACKKSKKEWQRRLNKFKINIPQKEIINVLKANVAYILINKDDAGLQPGSRNYNRTWMRDGAVTAAALMRTGHLKEAREYIDWVTGFQEDDGKVPPIIHSEGYVAKWDKDLNEYDAQGEYIFTVSDYYRFTKDAEFLKDKFPHILSALRYLKKLRGMRMTEKYDRSRYYGILPESISHEGYAAPGKHSYWDDYWGLKGLKDAQYLASALGEKELIPQMKEEELDFRKCLLDSIQLTQKIKGITYIPGCAELGDFDATSVAISVWPTQEHLYLPIDDFYFTFGKYYQETFLPRLNKGLTSGYTPYELRTANAYLILGSKDKALKMLNYFLKDMRPRNWKHWGEVVHPGYRAPKYVGDMPHTWIGAIYVNLVRNLFAFEKDDKLILAAGVNNDWLNSKEGVTVENLLTYYGKINYTINKDEQALKIKVWGEIDAPPEGIIFSLPPSEKISYIKINGRRVEKIENNELKFNKLPVKAEIYYENSN